MSQTPINKPHKSKREGKSAQSIHSPAKPAMTIKAHLQCGLYLVATPIGNLGDFSPRAQQTLEKADLILAEDTRVTRKLMGLFGIAGKVERCDEAATEAAITRACDVLAQGGVVAFCSDAGTPGVSDPGERLTRGVIDAGFSVQAIPGASAVLCALILSGLPSAQFMFAGFAPAKAGARLSFFQDVSAIKATLIFYETGPRLSTSLSAMASVFGDRPACVARELTKMYEETRRGSLGDLAAFYQEHGPPRGEIVIVVGGAPLADQNVSATDLDTAINEALVTLSVKDAAAQIAALTGLPKRDVYARALALGKAKSP
jgi:16S rRNA (cytidine1402-2'-O)-methyltransferase